MTAPTTERPTYGTTDPFTPPAAPPPGAAGRRHGRGPRRRRGLAALALAGVAVLAAGSYGLGTLQGGAGSPAAATTTAAAPAAPAPALGTASAGGVDARAVLAQAGPAVVSLRTSGVSVSDQLQPVAREGAGSGFVVDADGVVVTNAHVVAGATQVTVTFSDGTTVDGRVLGTDAQHDLAAVQVDRTGLPTVELARSADVAVGQPVVAIGNALALPGGPTVTTGIVSAVDRSVTEPNGVTLEGLVQTDAAINPGNSGGPLLDGAGRVVGVNTAGATQAENIGFAVQADTVRAQLDALVSGEIAGVPFLGVQTATVDDAVRAQFDLSADSGALVVSVQPGTAAAEAGLRAGDVVTRLGGAEVASGDDLGAALRQLSPGDRTTVRVDRAGSTTELPVRVGSRGATG